MGEGRVYVLMAEFIPQHDWELVKRVSESRCMEGLSGKPRYDIYMAPGVTAEQYIGWLGCDFDNKQHNFITAEFARIIAWMDGSDPVSARVSIDTATFHDAQEFIVADINFNLKTAESDIAEADILPELVITGDLDVPLEIAKEASGIMKAKAAGIDANTPEKVIIFDLSEYLGYLASAKTSWDASLNKALNIPDEQRERLWWLASNVLANCYGKLLGYAETRNSALFVANRLDSTFGEILHYTTDIEKIAKYRDYYAEINFKTEKVEKIETNLLNAHELWKKFDKTKKQIGLVASNGSSLVQ